MCRLYQSGVFSHLDIYFARFTARLAGRDVPEVSLAAALVSRYTRKGHVCLDLSALEGKPFPEQGEEALLCPRLADWCRKLRESPVVGAPGEYNPLVLDEHSRLYLYRYWDYQERLADQIRKRVGRDYVNTDPELLGQGLTRFFPRSETRGIDWQRVAAFSALTSRFSVISGGPGTGKTTTVGKILALLIEQAEPDRLRIALVAPTGKAAARLHQAIEQVRETLDCPEGVKEAIPREASTIHRLLGSVSGSPYFRHHAGNPLPHDVVVVDEASMGDLALMSKLVQALHPRARLILLGDRDQLASVEAGSVLGDICDTGTFHGFSRGFSDELKRVGGCEIDIPFVDEDGAAIQDCIVELQESYRFGRDSGIGALSRAVNSGDSDRATRLLAGSRYGDIGWRELPRPEALPGALREPVVEGFHDYLKTDEPWEAFRRFDGFRILCALREGPYGVAAINSLVERILKRERIIEADQEWYLGRPVLITRNDYDLQLFNGDVGIMLPDGEAGGELRVFFPAPDRKLKRANPVRLPESETAYAMTVHKSQGSEFDRVLFLLPDRDSPVLTRELLYTGITRARESVEVWGPESVFRGAVSRRTERTSGLRDALWECVTGPSDPFSP
ncbi:MAG: exodeoxyribonuclease V subunit alpha [Deltaproteobacteria bacterium]|nr:exodeoxyribonuclease V subunit alpha [Deltaproteobacteria bacterium]